MEEFIVIFIFIIGLIVCLLLFTVGIVALYELFKSLVVPVIDYLINRKKINSFCTFSSVGRATDP